VKICPFSGERCDQNCALRTRYGCALAMLARALYRLMRAYEEVQGVGPSTAPEGEEGGEEE